MPKLVALMYELRKQAPARLIQSANENIVPTSSSASSWPLGKGGYPSFHRFAKGAVDFQQKERERLGMDEEDLRRKRQMEQDLWERITSFKVKEEAWAQQQQVLMCIGHSADYSGLLQHVCLKITLDLCARYLSRRRKNERRLPSRSRRVCSKERRALTMHCGFKGCTLLRKWKSAHDLNCKNK
jgi:hypothetical protein